MKLPIDVLYEPLHDVNDKATNKLLTTFTSMTKDDGKARVVSVFAMIIYSKMSLRAFGSGFTGYTILWRNKIKNYRSQTNSNYHGMIPNSHLINHTSAIGTSRIGITCIVSSSIHNIISIVPLNGAKLNEPSWALLSMSPTLI